jgi:hypothetical protein
VGAHVLLGFNNRERDAPCARESIRHAGAAAKEKSFYIYVRRVKVLVLFSGMARIWARFFMESV